MNCADLALQIKRLISDGATRFRSEKAYATIGSLIQDFSVRCNALQAEYFQISLDLTFTQDSVTNVQNRLRVLLNGPEILPETEVDALNLSARLGFVEMPQQENNALRERALKVARDKKLVAAEVVVLTNWALASHYREEFKHARELVIDAERALSSLSNDTIQSDPALMQAVGRLLSHKAKAAFARIQDASASDPLNRLEEGNRLYSQAVAALSENDHYRVNIEIEWAEELYGLAAGGTSAALSLAMSRLNETYTGLDSHNCNLCRGYFYHVRAKVLWELAKNERTLDLQSALLRCESALNDCEASLTFYSKLVHPNVRFVNVTKEELMTSVAMLKRPRKIFLSHKSADKSFVLNFKEMLTALKFEPWIDVDALPAGVGLERGILQGFKDSCAVVFFITPEFKDEKFLATEIEYAISEKRDKGDLFSIITLVFTNASGHKGVVPDLLRNYVWKEPLDDLAALRELIRALPLDVSYPDWKVK